MFITQPNLRGRPPTEALGVMLGLGIQYLGDVATQRRIEFELQNTHATEIAEILARGEGVLVVIRMQEWFLPDINGMRARGLLGVYVEGGATHDAAMQSWDRPKYLKAAPIGWRTYEQYFWIDPNR